MKKQKNERKTMDIVLAIIAAVLVVFTTVMVITFWHIGSVPDVLITAVFGACLGEFGFMAWIKNVKERYGGVQDDAGFPGTADGERSDDNAVHGSDEETYG